MQIVVEKFSSMWKEYEDSYHCDDLAKIALHPHHLIGLRCSPCKL